ncbi:MAG: hypothetical protein ACTSRG_08890 [Candidatus Helarchaeota archaeon]
MPKYNRFLIFGTISVMGIFITLAIYLFSLYDWFGFLLASIPASFSEFIILHYNDIRQAKRARQKIAELKIAVKEDITSEIGEEKRLLIQALNKKSKVTSQILESFRIYLRINIAELNELILDVDNTFLKCIELVKKARTKKAREDFNSKISDIFSRINQMDVDFNFKFNNLITTDLKFKKIIASFKEEWQKTLSKLNEIIKQTQDKFEINTNFIYFIEDIFRFEIEKNRSVQKEDYESLEIPRDQMGKLLKYINKSVKVRLSELDKEKKKKFGALGKKVIAYFSNLGRTPNLPIMVINLGMGITEAKEILSYLKEVGMIDEIKYHIK